MSKPPLPDSAGVTRRRFLQFMSATGAAAWAGGAAFVRAAAPVTSGRFVEKQPNGAAHLYAARIPDGLIASVLG